MILLTWLYLFALFILSRAFGRLNIQQRSVDEPSLSVVVCAHDEEKNIRECLLHLAAQRYPAEKLEFIIVDDCSGDQTAPVVEEFIHHDHRFKFIRITERSKQFAPKKFAIDQAIRSATGDIILLTDADGRPGANWATSITSHFTAETDMVIGYAPYSGKPGLISRIFALEYLSHAAIAAATAAAGFPITCVGTNMAYRKKLYLDIDGFGQFKNYLSGDDDLFLMRVRETQKYGIRYVVDENSHVHNAPPQSWRQFFHQRIRYASKGFAYSRQMTAGLIIYFCYNLILLSALFIGLFDLKALFLILPILAIKVGGDFLFMRSASAALHDQRHLSLIPLTSLLHIPYVIVFGILGQIKQFRWAGERG